MIEVEVRARLIHPQKLKQELEKRNAKFINVLNQRDFNYAFEKPGEHVKEGGILARVREENENIRLEFKEILREKGAGIDIGANISDTELGKRLFSKLGLNYLSII